MSGKKIVVITGGSSGIGQAIAQTLIKKEFIVINADVAAANEASEIDHIECDITVGEDIDRLYNYVKKNYGSPDILISNAGQGVHEKLAEGDPEKWKRVIDINLIGALRFLRAFLPDMLSQKKGDIIITSSTAGKQVYEYGGVYAASKAALNTVAKTLQLETAGILRVFLVSPGVVDTSFFKNMFSSNHGVEDIGLGSLSAEQVADIVLYLLNLPPSVAIPELTLVPPKQVL